MTRFALPVLGLAVLLAIPARTYAQEPSRAFVSTAVGGVTIDAHSAHPQTAAAMARAMELGRVGNYRKAARAYHDIAETQWRAGELPEMALWQEASMYFALEENARAAAALDKLGDRASDYGDPVVEARAKLNAAVLYYQIGDIQRAMALADDLRMLRNSPFLSDELRADIDLRLGRK